MDKAVLVGLDNARLADLLLRIVWQGYDAGGISYGRSLRAFLLEAARELLPSVNANFGPVNYPSVLAEAVRREGTFGQQLVLFPGRGRIDKLLDCQFAQLLLAEIQRWHREQGRDAESFYQDKELISLAQKLLPQNRVMSKYSRAVVIEEAQERIRIVRERALAEWDKERILRDQEIFTRMNQAEQEEQWQILSFSE